MCRVLLAGDLKSVMTPVNRGLRPYMAAVDRSSLKHGEHVDCRRCFPAGDGKYRMHDWRLSHERICKQSTASNNDRPTSVHNSMQGAPASFHSNPPAEEVVTAKAQRWVVDATRTSCPPATLASSLALAAIHELEACFLRITASFHLLCPSKPAVVGGCTLPV